MVMDNPYVGRPIITYRDLDAPRDFDEFWAFFNWNKKENFEFLIIIDFEIYFRNLGRGAKPCS